MNKELPQSTIEQICTLYEDRKDSGVPPLVAMKDALDKGDFVPGDEHRRMIREAAGVIQGLYSYPVAEARKLNIAIERLCQALKG